MFYSHEIESKNRCFGGHFRICTLGLRRKSGVFGVTAAPATSDCALRENEALRQKGVENATSDESQAENTTK
jgi:hypothetical protein